MKRHRKHVKVNIQRAGDKVDILRASGGTENGYGKTPDSSKSWSVVSTEYTVMDAQSGGSFRNQTVTGGSKDIATPKFRFPYDSAIQDSDRFKYLGVTYEVRNIAKYSTHFVIDSVVVDGEA